MKSDELEDFLASWQVALEAERKSRKTVKTYTDGIRVFLAWCAREGRPPELDRDTLRAFTASLLASGAAPATALARQHAVRRISAWLAAEDYIDRDELLGVKPVKLDQGNVPGLADEELARLVRACQGKTFRDRRDEAIVRLAAETGTRAEELLSMTVADVDVRGGIAVVVRGKGGRGRRVPFGPRTAQAIDRYVRMRRAHKLASEPALWLGDRGRRLGYAGLYRALRERADMAGIEGFHPHRLRHTAASRWLAAGGSEGGLMAVAGWKSRDMLDRYVRDTAMSRAAEEARRLGLGDL